MEHIRQITLPSDELWYTTERDFPVSLVAGKCASYSDPRKSTYALAMEQSIESVLKKYDSTKHRATIESITEASMRFFQSHGIKTYEDDEYDNSVFMLRHDFGQVFEATSDNSIKPKQYQESTKHSEAARVYTEMFGYGLGLHFAAKALGIAVERFEFIAASNAGSRPGFNTKLTIQELLAQGATTRALVPGDFYVDIEIKARTGWGGFRPGKDGQDLLLNLAKKCAGSKSDAFLAILITLPRRGTSSKGLARILIADPGTPKPVSNEEIAEMMLKQLLRMCYRNGLWKVVTSILEWLQALRIQLTHDERQLILLSRNFEQDVAALEADVWDKHDGRIFIGNIRSNVIDRLGTRRYRGLTQREAERIYSIRQFGEARFRGIDKKILDIIENRNLRALLTYGVTANGTIEWGGKSAFIVSERPRTQDYVDAIGSRLGNALKHWEG